MKKFFDSYKHILIPLSSFLVLVAAFLVIVHPTFAADVLNGPYDAKTDLQIDTSKNGLGFQIPSLGDILTFAVRGFFTIAGLAALFYMLLGAFAWVTSGGDKDAVSAAQQKIQAAVIGVIIIVAVLAIIWTLEQVVFGKAICFGVSCPVTIPTLIKN